MVAYTTLLIFGYYPIDALAWMAMSVFIVFGAIQLWVNLKYRPCMFMMTLVVSAWFEAVGYGLRPNAAHNPGLITFIFPTLFILLVPNALALVRPTSFGCCSHSRFNLFSCRIATMHHMHAYLCMLGELPDRRQGHGTQWPQHRLP